MAHSLDLQDETSLADIDRGGLVTPVFVVAQGPKAGSRFALDAPVVKIGRHPDSDIFLDDITVSRRHAEISHDGDRFVVRDVGSLNGTYVNRERVEDRELHDGDELQVGKYKLAFVVGHG